MIKLLAKNSGVISAEPLFVSSKCAHLLVEVLPNCGLFMVFEEPTIKWFENLLFCILAE
jgi:hypothetical protein